MHVIEWDDFAKVEIRVGTIIAVDDFPKARNPAYKLMIDFGEEVGVKKSSARITDLYSKDEKLQEQNHRQGNKGQEGGNNDRCRCQLGVAVHL